MRRFFGGLMMALGILLMTGSGLCTVAVLVSMFSSGGGTGNAGMAVLPLVVGGIPFGAGIGLFVAGRSLLKPSRPPSNDELADRFR